MNWMFESRSKDYYYDDSEGGSYSSSMTWREILLSPLYIILFLIYLVIIEVLIIKVVPQ